MRSLVLIDQAEGFLRITLSQKIEREIGGDVGGIARMLLGLSVDDEVGIEVYPLSRQRLPFVKASRFLADVPFAHQPRAVAGLLQQLRERRQIGVERLDGVGSFGVAANAVNVRVAAGQNRGAAGGANGIRGKRVGESHAFVGQPVHVGGLENRMPGAAHLLESLVVRHHEKNIRAAIARPRAAAGGKKGGGSHALECPASGYAFCHVNLL